MARTVSRWGAGLALLAGLLALYTDTPLPAQGKDEVIKIVVANVDLLPGTVIKDPAKQLAIKPFLKSSAPAEAVENLDDLRGKVLTRAVDRGMPVTFKDTSGFPPYYLLRPAPDGYRAVTVKLDPAGAVSGFAVPGAHVDVVAAVLGTASNPSARLVLQNVLILAVNGATVAVPGFPLEKEGKDWTALVTFAVKAQDGLKLAEAIATPNSKITLLLRRPGDDVIVNGPGTGKP